jgi:hypothetical protein
MRTLKYLPVLFSVILYQNVCAQWTNTSGVFSRMIKCFTAIDATVIAGTEQGLVRSTDNGTTWANAGGDHSTPFVRCKRLPKHARFAILFYYEAYD